MFKRFRRLRINPAIRQMVRETSVCASDFIYPLFVVEGKGVKKDKLDAGRLSDEFGRNFKRVRNRAKFGHKSGDIVWNPEPKR